MHKRSSNEKHKDINELAARIVEEATSDKVDTIKQDEENPRAQALGRLGGLKGGKARAKKLSPEQRREIA
jgi:hypothetical protein